MSIPFRIFDGHFSRAYLCSGYKTDSADICFRQIRSMNLSRPIFLLNGLILEYLDIMIEFGHSDLANEKASGN